MFHRICLCHMARTVIFQPNYFSEYIDDPGDELLFSVNLFWSLIQTERDIPGVVFLPLRSSRRSRKWNFCASFSSAKDGKGSHIEAHRMLKVALKLDQTPAKIPFSSGRERNFKPKNGVFRKSERKPLLFRSHWRDFTGGRMLSKLRER